MTVKLVKYDKACKAIAAAKSVDEVKDIRDIAIAMKAYARQAHNHDLEADAVEIRMRATRRMDQMRREQKETVGLSAGTRGSKTKGARVDSKPTLADVGIDKNLAHEGRKLGALSDDDFEIAVEAAREATNRIVRDALREVRGESKKERREKRETELATKIMALPGERYGVILADPEWRFEPWSRETGMDRAADNHYPTSLLETIKERDVPSIAADDAVLFLWATAAMLPHALLTMAAWGFDYKSQIVWVKDQIGTGYWFRNKHELLLLGTRGNIPAPEPGTQWPSAFHAAVGEHSEKPEAFLEMIEQYYPNIPKIELNRRGPARAGWSAWGNEVPEAAE